MWNTLSLIWWWTVVISGYGEAMMEWWWRVCGVVCCCCCVVVFCQLRQGHSQNRVSSKFFCIPKIAKLLFTNWILYLCWFILYKIYASIYITDPSTLTTYFLYSQQPICLFQTLLDGGLHEAFSNPYLLGGVCLAGIVCMIIVLFGCAEICHRQAGFKVRTEGSLSSYIEILKPIHMEGIQ